MSFGAAADPKADYALPTPPGDGISDITFSPNGTLLTAASWDNGVRSITKIQWKWYLLAVPIDNQLTAHGTSTEQIIF